MNVQKERVEYIDLFRGIGIVLMIMGHIGFGNKFDHYIHAFHMPMFYFVSGLFFKTKSKAAISTIAFIKTKAKSLLVPYLFFALFHFLIACMLEKTFLYKNLLHIFSFNTYGMPIAGALWFLTSLYITEVLYFLLDRYVNNMKLRNVIILLFVVVGNLENVVLPYRLPFAMGPSFVGLGLFHLARVMRCYREGIVYNRIMRVPVVAYIIGGVVVTISIFLNGYINMRMGEYACIPLFWINAMGSIIVGLLWSKLLTEKFRNKLVLWLTNVGKNSIVYLCLNQLVILLLNKCIEYIELPQVLSIFLVFILVMVILFGCGHVIINTRLKFIIGKS